MNKILLSFTLGLSILSALQAQDKHFTQNFAAPMLLNPSLTGGFDGRYRFSLIYRDQWRSVLNQPYTTFAAGLDLRFPVGYMSSKTEDGFGAGMTFYTDRVPIIGFSTTELGFSTAYHKSLNERNNQYLSLGLQLGLNQRNVTYENLDFEDEFNGASGYTGASQEILPSNNFAFTDFAVGLNYSYAPKNQFGLFLGAALHHIFEPQVSFYYDRRNDDPERGDDVLSRRITGHISARIPVSKSIMLMPRAVAMIQGPHTQINAGSNVRLAIGDNRNYAVHVGGWVRPISTMDESLELAAAILMTGFEVNNVLFGFSYDLSLTDIQSTQQGQSSFEISIAYLGNYDNETILCPKF